MRKIEVEDGLRVRFPGRSASFCEGVEIGILLSRLGDSRPMFSQTLSVENAEQARVLADKFGYRLVLEPGSNETVIATLTAKGLRPKLRVVSA